MLNLSKTYRTAAGDLVRGLRFHYRAERVVIETRVVGTGRRERVIQGEIKQPGVNDWVECVWKEDGTEYHGDAKLDLREYKEQVVHQPKLF